MAIELHLQKTSKTPWGFRLAGGVEYEVPLTVIKVAENSIAQNSGMQEGDIVVKLNDIPMAELTHNQAHDVLLSAGNDFVLEVKRSDLSHLPPRLFLYETSLDNAEDRDTNDIVLDRKEDEENNDKDLNITDAEIVSIIGEQVHSSTQKGIEKNIETPQESKIQVQSEVSKIILSEESQKTEEKKWSTFLQKPKNLKPKPTKKEPEGPKAPPYRVIIKKQPKKSQECLKKISNEDEGQEDNKFDIVAENEENFNTEEEQNETDAKIIETFKSPTPELDKNDINNNDGVEAESVERCSENEDQDEELDDIPDGLKARRTSFLSEKRLSINLEEQLAQVQRQLLALSQLPSAIQQTLNAVTQQLSEIVSAKHAQEQEITIEGKATIEEEITEEYLDVSDEREEKALSVLEEESYENLEEEAMDEEVRTGTVEGARNESEDEQALFEDLEKQIEEEERRKEEDLEARRIEQEKIQKRDKVNHWNNIWPWSDTEKPVYRINFLKFQPPPKNLDYLQKSAVYRFVHDIEPPPRGVIARDGKILAEQDYYAEKEENLSPQMER